MICREVRHGESLLCIGLKITGQTRKGFIPMWKKILGTVGAVALVGGVLVSDCQAVEAYEGALTSMSATLSTAVGLILAAVITGYGLVISFPIVRSFYKKITAMFSR
jgi:hypothetical protein